MSLFTPRSFFQANYCQHFTIFLDYLFVSLSNVFMHLLAINQLLYVVVLPSTPPFHVCECTLLFRRPAQCGWQKHKCFGKTLWYLKHDICLSCVRHVSDSNMAIIHRKSRVLCFAAASQVFHSYNGHSTLMMIALLIDCFEASFLMLP